ncbi:MAG: hypothetical protein JWO88_1331 [Frankiales bacterium]|nr:hypothetical protein [Frankiales bacterium]
MTDLQNLLRDAGRPGADPSAHVVDDDVARGRGALARRRLRRGGTRGVLVAAAVGSLFIVQAHGGGHPGPTGSAIQPPRLPVTKPMVKPSIKLVAYTGSQPAGYTVDFVPAGWEIQGVNHFVLTIAAVGDPDKQVDSFAGKLVAMLMSKGGSIPTTGKRVAVGSTTGIVSHFDPSAAQLFFTDAKGHVLDIQVPPALHWTDEQIGEFGAAVHVNPTAQAGEG